MSLVYAPKSWMFVSERRMPNVQRAIQTRRAQYFTNPWILKNRAK